MDIATTTGAAADILVWISQYGYLALLPLFILEGASVGFIAGGLISLGALDPVPVFLLYVTGTIIADSLLYQLARSGSTILQKVPFARNALARLDFYEKGGKLSGEWVEKFKRHYFPLMFLAKLSPVPAGSQVVATVAGAVKLPPRKFYPPILIGQPIWSGLMIGTGYYLGDTIQNPMKLLSEAGAFTVVGLLVIVFYFYYVHGPLKQELRELTSARTVGHKHE